MPPRYLPAAALLVVVLAGCGGGSSSSAAREQQAAAERWSAGLRSWGSGMTVAINGISLIFSRPADVRGILAGSNRVGLLLERYEQTLAGCSARVGRLGAPPTSLVLAQREALHACISLERAARLIRSGVRAFQHGLGPEGLNATGEPLTAGEDGVRRATLDLLPG